MEDDWSQVAIFVVAIVILFLVGRFLRARGYVGSGGNGNGDGDGDGGGNGGD